MSTGERDANERGGPGGSAESDLGQAKTRVLDDGQTEIVLQSAEDLAVAETRVLLDEDDKTSPPPVAPAASAEPASNAAAAPRTAAAPRAAPAPREADRGLQPGTVLFGEYEIVNVLGVGGMGEVYRARHRRLDEHRAIKVMHAELSKRKGASEFFYREAKALLAVRHPAVVHCHDLLSDDAGRVYLIMEMIEGIPLSRKLSQGPLSPDDVAMLGARVAHGLAAAHRKGVIHRDLSPDNIVLPNGRVQDAKIIDFGIAKLLEQGEGTIVDGFKGKLSYASPEQLGFFGGKLDGRSDLYSLGLVLAAAALGRPMAMGTTVMEAVDARRDFRVLPDAIPIGLRSAIQPLLALDPKDRPQYVDRLFAVPGAFDGSTDPGDFHTVSSAQLPRGSRPAVNPAQKSRRTLYFGVPATVALLVASAFYVAPLVTQTPMTGESESDASLSSEPVRPTPAIELPPAESGAVLGAVPSDRVTPGVAPPENVAQPVAEKTAEPVRVPTVAVAKPAAPSHRGPSASDRLRIVGMLTNAKLALGENRLMSPPGDNAYDRYRSVLRLEPGNASAKSGLRDIASRYVKRANEAIDEGDTAAARDHLRHARQADASHSGIRAAEQRLSTSSG